MIYNVSGSNISSAYDRSGSALPQAYDVAGNPLLDGGGGGGDDEFIKTILPYDSNYMINASWLENATTQRNALITAYQASEDAIPFFIQTDGHGRYNEGNKGCHNLAEETMGYIRNIQLGDYGSYYSNGNNPINHANTSLGISKYLTVMGNHEFLNNNSDDAELADLTKLVPSYTPPEAILGNAIYGYYKLLDDKYSVKYLVTQTHIPDSSDSKGFVWMITEDQYQWLINELESNDGYDIVVIQHEPLNGTYAHTSSDTTHTANFTGISIGEILAARKAKTSGTFTDSDGNEYTYDFTSCTGDLLCSLHGHHHNEAYMTKTTLGFPVYLADWFGRNYTCAYGLIDRDAGKLKIWRFTRYVAADVLELDL